MLRWIVETIVRQMNNPEVFPTRIFEIRNDDSQNAAGLQHAMRFLEQKQSLLAGDMLQRMAAVDDVEMIGRKGKPRQQVDPLHPLVGGMEVNVDPPVGNPVSTAEIDFFITISAKCILCQTSLNHWPPFRANDGSSADRRVNRTVS